MKLIKSLHIAASTAFFAVAPVYGQGFIYDQQSSTDETPWPYGAGANIQMLSPYGQSFTPNLSAVSFIRLNLNDNNPNNSLGATIYLNLRTNSIDGAILATTPSVTLTNGFTGTVNFSFLSDILLSSAATYTFEIIPQPGSDSWNATAGEYNYPGGLVFANGIASSGSDLWFREGIIAVPEPSSVMLVLLSGVGLFFSRRHSSRRF